ncbi:MAG: adenylate/guanylate cyclase domain-containing protein [Actinomycetota bacterium]
MEERLAETNTRENLAKLLDELGEHPERIAEITGQIEKIFSEERTVMILDMSGFTRMTQEGNLIAYLLMINQMKRLALPCVEEAGGILVKAEHDNLTCLFDDVPAALEASRQITSRLESANVVLPTERELYVSIGIGHGTILNVGNADIYGDEVNLASKLGEDIAEKGDILLTARAYDQVKDQDIELKKETISISGIRADYYRLTP